MNCFLSFACLFLLPNVSKGTAFLKVCFRVCCSVFSAQIFHTLVIIINSFFFFLSISSQWVEAGKPTKAKSKWAEWGHIGMATDGIVDFNGKRHWSSLLITVSCNRAELAWYCMLLYDAKCCHPPTIHLFEWHWWEKF